LGILHLKLDELLRAMQGAKNSFINLEELTEEDLTRIKERYARLAEAARAKPDLEHFSGSPRTTRRGERVIRP
jgi:low affinity Fe/Cu permease